MAAAGMGWVALEGRNTEVRVEMKHATMTAYTASRHRKKMVVSGWRVRYGIDLKARIDS